MKVTYFLDVNRLSLPLLLPFVITSIGDRTLAQNRITPDQSLREEASRVTRKAGAPTIEIIQGGARRGKLLFHSFQEFNVKRGSEATFFNPKGVDHILTRVTGPFRSNILGTLGVEGQANLLLLNPNGIYFGPQSQLNITGSFFASTAQALEWEDGATFRADTSQIPSLLTMHVPIGIQLGPEDISSAGRLEAGQNLTLAADQLHLSGPVMAGRDLSLQGNEVIIHDRDRPIAIAAGRRLKVLGRDLIDINALQHSESGLFTGENLLLRSRNPIVADARFSAGGHLKVQNWTREFGSLVSRTDPVIFANGNVDLGDYTGASLHILGGASIRLGDILITDRGPVASTINPQNQAKVNKTLTYGDLASFEVSGFELRKNQKGKLARMPTRQTIEIDGYQRATLDVRAGVDWQALGGLPNISVMGDTLPFSKTEQLTNANIIIDGNVKIDQPGGQVLLTNQFRPNTHLKAGVIKTQSIDTSVKGLKLKGGDIAILGRGDIINSFIDASSTVTLDQNNTPLNRNESAGNSGDILIFSTLGNVRNDNIRSYSKGDIGEGGDISISSISGKIANQNLYAGSYSKFDKSGRGGNITVFSISGEITNKNLLSPSFSRDGKSARGGDIIVSSISGEINNQNLRSASTSFKGEAGRGGDISISSMSSKINNKNIRSASIAGMLNNENSGRGGDITVSSISGTLNNQTLQSASFSAFGNAGQGGNITISSRSGEINNQDLRSASSSGGGGSARGGDIIVSSISGNIDSQLLRSSSVALSSRDSGQGGDIKVSSIAGNIQLLDNIASFSYSDKGHAGDAGRITIQSNQGGIGGQLNEDNISQPQILSFSIGDRGSSKGGNITLQGNSVSNLKLLTLSSSEQSGNVRIEGGNKALLIKDLEIIASARDTLEIISSIDDFEEVNLDPNQIGASGNVTITSSTPTQLKNVTIESNSNGRPSAGAVKFSTLGSLVFRNSAISTNANRSGMAGKLDLVASDVVLDNSQLSAKATSSGDGGSISLNLRKLTLSQASEITTSTTGDGKGGNILITSPDHLTIQGNGRILSESTSKKAAGNLTIRGQTSDGQLSLIESLTIADVDRLSVRTHGSGQAGTLTIQAKNVNLDNSILTASTTGEGRGGNINLKLNRLIFSNESKIRATTINKGNGGNITVSSPKTLTIQGQGSITAEAKKRVEDDKSLEIGSAGNLILGGETYNGKPSTLDSLIIKDGPTLSVNSIKTAGTLKVIANNILLDSATLQAKANQPGIASNEAQENIQLNVSQFLLLKNRSSITAEASNRATGGNILINAPTGVVIGLPSLESGNDITAKAEEGKGGNITINAKSIIGFTEAEAIPNNKTNDIDASSDSSLQGTVNLNTSNTDPSENVLILPTSFSPPQVKHNCQRGGGQNKFIYVHRGGKVPEMDENVGGLFWDDTRSITSTTLDAPGLDGSSSQIIESIPSLTEAQGWLQDDDGNIQLVDMRSTALKLTHHSEACHSD